MKIEDIKTLPDESIVLHLLRKDDYWKKLNGEQKKYYVNESLALGHKAANLFMKEYGHLSLEEIRERFRLRIKKDEYQMQLEVLHLHAHLDIPSRIISMNPRATITVEEIFQTMGEPIDRKQVIRMLLFRSFYHIFAREQGILPSEVLQPLEIRRLGIFPSEEIIKQTDFAAAEIFAKYTTNFPVFPALLSYMRLVQQEKATEDQILALFEQERSDYENGNRN